MNWTWTVSIKPFMSWSHGNDSTTHFLYKNLWSEQYIRIDHQGFAAWMEHKENRSINQTGPNYLWTFCSAVVFFMSCITIIICLSTTHNKHCKWNWIKTLPISDFNASGLCLWFNKWAKSTKWEYHAQAVIYLMKCYFSLVGEWE